MVWSLLYTAVPIAALFATFVGAAAWPRTRRRTRIVPSPDGSLIAMIVPVGVHHGLERMESRVEIHSTDGMTLCARDFSSADGNAGLGVVQAQWSADSKYFIFSTAPTGKRQRGHWPSFVYGRSSNTVRELEDDGKLIASPKFSLIPPHSVRTQCINAPGYRGRFEIIIDLEQFFRQTMPAAAN